MVSSTVLTSLFLLTMVSAGRLATELDGKSLHKCALSRSAIHIGMCPNFRRTIKILKLGKASNDLHEAQNVICMITVTTSQ